MLLYKREVLGGDPHLWIPMDPYWSGGTLKVPAVQKIRSQPRAGNTRDGVGSHPGPRLADLPCGVPLPPGEQSSLGAAAGILSALAGR